MRVMIADDNDNKMEEGESSIEILKMEGTKLPDMEIGRVFVNDLDDDDLKDKNFRWSDHDPPNHFTLDRDLGMIKLVATVNGSQIVDGEYSLNFSVIESFQSQNDLVLAFVNVSVKSVSEEAVRKSSSIRFHGTIGIKVEQFITSIKILRNLFVDLFDTTEENVQIITISQKSIEPLLIDILPNYIPIVTNQTSFYGINTYVQPQCGCETLSQSNSSNESVSNVIGFKGNGYAIYSGISHCDVMNISLNINSNINSGTILYIGPMDSEEIQTGDSIELLLEDELLVLAVNHGPNLIRLGNFKLPKQKNHFIEISYQNDTIELVVKDCHSCLRKFEIFQTTKFAKLSYPIQLGGVMEFLLSSFTLYQGFFGCISNFTINGVLLNVNAPILQSNISNECFILPDRFYLWLLVALVTALTMVSIVVIYCFFCKKKKEEPEEENKYYFDNKRESGILLGNNRQSFKNDQNFY
ncbi:unnamed protein product [Diamesa tonsa]